MKIPNDRVQKIDRPELCETYVDSIGLCTFDGMAMRMELCITRLDEPKPPAAPKAKRYPCCRLVLSPEAAVDVFNSLQQMLGAMAASGIVKQEQAPPVNKPN